MHAAVVVYRVAIGNPKATQRQHVLVVKLTWAFFLVDRTNNMCTSLNSSVVVVGTDLKEKRTKSQFE